MAPAITAFEWPSEEWFSRAQAAALQVRSRSCWEVREWKNKERDGISYVKYVYAILLYYPHLEDKFGIYVGCTSKKPHQRFRVHKSKHHTANSDVHEYGKQLLPQLYRHLNPMRPSEGEKIERELYLALRNANFTWVSMGQPRPQP